MTSNRLNIKKDSNAENEGQKSYKAQRKQRTNDRSQSLLIGITLNVNGLNFLMEMEIGKTPLHIHMI